MGNFHLIASSLWLLLTPSLGDFLFAAPPTPGPYSVGTISLEAIDYSRLDPYAPTPGPRALMVSLFYPTSDTTKPFAPYLPNPMAAYADVALSLQPGVLEALRTQSYLNARMKEVPDIPIILFSPGFGAARELYTVLLEGLASYGYLVVALDHTYDAALMQFPDGTVIEGIPTIVAQEQSTIDIRTSDTLFILNQLSNSSWISQVPGVVHRNFAENKVAMFGHSLGGTTTLQAMELSKRILGGCELDGPFVGSQITAGTKKPFFYFGRDNHTRFNDPKFKEAWKHIKGWKAELTLINSTHTTFGDEGPIFTEMGVIDQIDPGGLHFGTINGLRAAVVQIAYVKGFFDFVLKGGNDGIFKHADAAYPEVRIEK